MDFYTYLTGSAMDAKPKGGETLAEHKKHCKAKPGNCPFEAKQREADKADTLGVGGGAPLSRDAFRKQLSTLVGELNKTGWTKGLEAKVSQAADAVLDGKAVPPRLPQDVMTRDRMKGISKPFLMAYLMACGSEDPKTWTNDSQNANGIVEKVLRGTGNWVDNISGKCRRRYGKPFADGSESEVFRNGANGVTKASTLGQTRNVIVAMERLMLSNALFPETAHTVIGMGSLTGNQNRANGHISFWLEQPKLSFGYLKSEKDVDKTLKRYGFQRDYGDEFVDKSGEIRLLDCKRINVPITKDGKVAFIDAPAVLNYWKAGALNRTSYLSGRR